MTSLKHYDRKIREWCKKPPVAGEVGIELELENVLDANATKYWKVKGEESLRDGVEFVLKKPIPLKEIKPALISLDLQLKKNKPRLSFRTSTHIHINVQELTITGLYNFLGFYYLVEDILVRTQGPLREGNLFCLRMSDAEGVLTSIIHGIRSNQHFLCMESSEHKYAALNLATIRTFNSAEFRFFRPMIDMGQLHAWVLLLHRMVHIASQIPLDETIHSLSLLSPRKFLMTVFTPSQTDMLLASLPEPRAREMLEENEDNVRRIAKALAAEVNKPYSIPNVALAEMEDYPGQYTNQLGGHSHYHVSFDDPHPPLIATDEDLDDLFPNTLEVE